MITSEITFLNMDKNILYEHDEFLESIGLSLSEKINYLYRLENFQREPKKQAANFKLQFPFFLDGISNKYTSFLYYTSDVLRYVSIRTETFSLNKRFKNRVFHKWNSSLSAGWFLEIKNLYGYDMIYSGDLRFLKKYLYQDPNIKAIDLPNCIAFKKNSDWHDFKWIIPENDVITNHLKN